MRILWLILVLLLGGCGDGADRQELHDRLIGAWRVDMAATEPELDDYIQQGQAARPDQDLSRVRDQLHEFLDGRELRFSKDAVWRSNGPNPGTMEYKILEHGRDYLLLRQYVPVDHPSVRIVGGPTILAQNQLDTEELVEHVGLINGSLPMVIGIEFEGEDRFRLFHLRVKDREITDEREYGFEVFVRVSDEAGDLSAPPYRPGPETDDPRQSRPFLYGSLLRVIEKGEEQQAKRLLAEHPWLVNDDGQQYDTSGDPFTPLHEAAMSHRREVVAYLLEQGADPNLSVGMWNQTALHLAVEDPAPVGAEIAQLLLDAGAEVSAQDDDGDTPLHLAVFWANEEAVRILLDHGADPTLANEEGDTPLKLAVDIGNSEPHRRIRRLLEKAARPEPTEAENDTE